MESRDKFNGIQSLSSVINSLERRYSKHSEDEGDEEEEDAEGDDGTNKRRKRPKKLKPTKEEEELIQDGEGFIDNSEVLEGEDEDAMIPECSETSSKNKLMALRVQASSSDHMQPEISLISSSASRAKFLADHGEEWTPPSDVQALILSLEDQIHKAFASPRDWNLRRRKGLGSIETHLLRVDRAALKSLPNGERTMGYLARLVSVFPEPFCRGKVVAHLQRVLLKHELRKREKQMRMHALEAVHTISSKLVNKSCTVKPGTLSCTSSDFSHITDMQVLENSNSCQDQAALSFMERTSQAIALAEKPLSHEFIKELKQKLSLWSSRALMSLDWDEPPPNSYVALREALEAAEQLDTHFVWDRETRGSVWVLGKDCRLCADARARLDAWVIERKEDLLLGTGEGVAKNYRPNMKDLDTYLKEAEEYILAYAFPSSDPFKARIGKTANIMRALREAPARYYFVNEQGDYEPYTGPKVNTPAVVDEANASGEIKVVASPADIEADTSNVQSTLAAGKDNPPSPANTPEHLIASKGRRFPRVEFNPDDFQEYEEIKVQV